MAKKAFKDFVIVANYAKLIKDYNYDKKANAILTCFAFGDAIADVIFHFGKDKRTKAVEIKIDDIYDHYGAKFYVNVKEFAKAICEDYVLTVTGDDELTFIKSEIKDNSFDHTASNGLSTVEAIFERIKQILALKIENPLNEEVIREIHRDYLKKQKLISLAIAIGGFAVFLLMIILFIANNGEATGFLGFLGFLATFVGLAAGIVYIFKFLRYKKELERSIRGYK